MLALALTTLPDPQLSAVEAELAWIDAVLAAYDGQIESRLCTFDDVERFWDSEVKPTVKDFESLKNSHADKEPPGPKSRWHANARFGDWG